MKNTGTLRIQTFAARQSAPVEGVTVAVQGDGFTLHRITDATGSAADIPVEAPACTLSLDEDNTTRPYAIVSLTAAKPGYRTVRIEGIQIFAGQVTLAQPQMLPVTEEDRDIPVFLGNRKHLGLRQRYLPGKDLDALNAHGAVAGLCGGQADNGVGASGVVLVQRQGAGGGFNGNIGGAAGGIGDAVQGKAVPLHRNGHPLHGGRLACRKGLDAESSGVFHGDTLLCW